MDKLKPCPFCGGTKLKIERKSRLAGWNGLDMRVEMHTYSVRCNTCHARGGAIGGRVMDDPWTRCSQFPDWVTTDKTLEAKAAEAWNRRVNDAPVRHGHWIGEGDGYADGELVFDVWHCSECDYCIDDGTDDPERLPKYCPGCGALMDGGNGNG